jgi:hypothetical protein
LSTVSIVETVRGARLAILGAVCLLGAPSPAAGHDPRGRAQPSVETTLKGSGLSRTIGFRVRDSDSGKPIPAATLSVRADDGGGSVTGEVARVQPELFRSRLDFPRPGNWSVQVRIDGNRVTPTSFSFDVPVVGGSPVDRSSSGGPDVWILVAISLAGLAGAVLAVALVERRRRRLRG